MRLYILFIMCALIVIGIVSSHTISGTEKGYHFSRVPILHEGRIKPLDSFARIYLKRWMGADHYKDKAPSQWLAGMVFEPQSTLDQQLFLIDDMSVLDQLNLLDKKRGLFSFNDLLLPIQKTKETATKLLISDEDNLTASQQKFLKLHENVAAYSNIIRSLSLLLTLDITLPQKFQDKIGNGPINYMSLITMEAQILDEVKSLIKRKGEDPENYTEEEQKTALLGYHMQTMRSFGERSDIFKVIPEHWDSEKNNEWHAPWSLILSGEGSPESFEYIALWRNLAVAYQSNNASMQDRASLEIHKYIQNQNLFSAALFDLEIIYNQIKPYDWARGFYAFAILCAIAGLFLTHGYVRSALMAFMALGILAHGFAIVARVLILDRPPVGTLYESVIFVALICALSGLVASIWRRNDFALLAGALSALGLLLVAPIIIPQGESLEVLVAVLNTNFWLATHVTIITAGYGVCIIAALMAHFYMVARLSKPKNDALVLQLNSAVHKTSLIALLLTAVGTVLGGIWADQSWGRFWGWDPKENGALLIVLWLIWAQHGRLSGHLRELQFIATMAFLNVIVAIAWFGVNLLGVGLHSYGFTSGIAYGLVLFCLAEMILIAALWISVRLRERVRNHVA